MRHTVCVWHAPRSALLVTDFSIASRQHTEEDHMWRAAVAVTDSEPGGCWRVAGDSIAQLVTAASGDPGSLLREVARFCAR